MVVVEFYLMSKSFIAFMSFKSLLLVAGPTARVNSVVCTVHVHLAAIAIEHSLVVLSAAREILHMRINRFNALLRRVTSQVPTCRLVK